MTKVTQTAFRAALFDPRIAAPEGLLGDTGAPAGKRFDVYRNNVMVSLKEAMRTGFPVIHKLLGDENFNAISSVFVRAHPPRDPRLALYGADFPAFLAGFEPLAHLPYLADVARLEWALRTSYNAADAPPLNPDLLAEAPPEALSTARLELAPASQLVRSSWPIADIWHFNMTDGAPQPGGGAQDVLITRPAFDPEMHVLPAGGADFIAGLAADAPLGPLLDRIHGDHSDFDFPSLIGLLLNTAALTALHLHTGAQNASTL